MDLQTIARRTQLPVRKIRYVLDHRLLPGLRVAGQPDAVGRARHVTDLEGFSIACAAVLLEAGVRKQAVEQLIDGLAAYPVREIAGRRRPVTAIEAAFLSPTAQAEALLGDGTNYRFRVGKTDTGWIQPKTFARLAADYQPRAVIRLDLARLRQAFLSAK